MNRRHFLRVTGIAAASVATAGCGGYGTRDEDDADVSVTVVRNAPDNPGPFVESAETVTEQGSEALAVDGIVFQRAGEKGLVVAGDATNTSDRAFGTITVAVTLYDEHETEDELLDSTTEEAERGRLGVGETWQWAATFGERPAFDVDYYAVTAAADYGDSL